MDTNKLTTIDLSFANLNSIPDLSDNIIAEALYLRGNPLFSLKKEDYNKFPPSLKYIDLGECQLKMIDLEHLHIKKVSLDHNYLEYVFKVSPAIEYLNLSNNKLTKIKFNHRLKTLDLSNNNFKYICGIRADNICLDNNDEIVWASFPQIDAENNPITLSVLGCEKFKKCIPSEVKIINKSTNNYFCYKCYNATCSCDKNTEKLFNECTDDDEENASNDEENASNDEENASDDEENASNDEENASDNEEMSSDSTENNGITNELCDECFGFKNYCVCDKLFTNNNKRCGISHQLKRLCKCFYCNNNTNFEMFSENTSDRRIRENNYVSSKLVNGHITKKLTL
jgi:hypothetical protein